MANKRREAEFTTELHRGAEAQGFHRVPVPDSLPPRTKDGKRVGGVRAKVYDLGLLKQGVYHGIELKYTDGNTLRASDFKPHQPGRLRNVCEKGGIGWVAVMFHDTKARKRECWAAWAVNVFTEFENGRVSVDRAWFEKFGVQLEQFKAPILDPKTFEPKLYDNGTKLGRAWSFQEAHALGLGYLERTWLAG